MDLMVATLAETSIFSIVDVIGPGSVNQQIVHGHYNITQQHFRDRRHRRQPHHYHRRWYHGKLTRMRRGKSER